MTAFRARGASATGWVLLGALAGLPLLALAVQAATTGWFFPQLVPREWTLETMRRVASDPATREAMVNGLVVGVAVTAVALVLAVPAARALALGRHRHVRAVGLLVLLPTVLPPVALAMGLDVVFLRAGIGGTIGAVVLAHLVATLPYAVLLLTAALTRYDPGHERQAAVLGAGPARILLRVFVPLATPALVVTAALAFIVSWSQYLLTFLPGGGRVVTLPVLLLAASGGGDPTTAAALALVAAVPPALAVLLVLRRLDTAGGAA